ncbi:MAG: hypothetical protein PHI90_10155, partial [Clostridia bacterium]|nr:hypothetical protein [Clostridia bacterium]
KGMEVSNVWIAGLPDSLERIRIEKDLVPLCDWSWLKKLKEERKKRFEENQQEDLSEEPIEERQDGEVKPAEQQTDKVTNPSTEEKSKKRKERQIGD